MAPPPPPPPAHPEEQGVSNKKCTFDARGLYLCGGGALSSAASVVTHEQFFSKTPLARPERFYSKLPEERFYSIKKTSLKDPNEPRA